MLHYCLINVALQSDHGTIGVSGFPAPHPELYTAAFAALVLCVARFRTMKISRLEVHWLAPYLLAADIGFVVFIFREVFRHRHGFSPLAFHGLPLDGFLVASLVVISAFAMEAAAADRAQHRARAGVPGRDQSAWCG